MKEESLLIELLNRNSIVGRHLDSFNLAKDCRVSICIYNSAGQQIDCLIDEFRTSGMHNVEWNTSNLAKGIYFYSLETDGFEQVRRAVKL